MIYISKTICAGAKETFGEHVSYIPKDPGYMQYTMRCVMKFGCPLFICVSLDSLFHEMTIVVFILFLTPI